MLKAWDMFFQGKGVHCDVKNTFWHIDLNEQQSHCIAAYFLRYL